MMTTDAHTFTRLLADSAAADPDTFLDENGIDPLAMLEFAQTVASAWVESKAEIGEDEIESAMTLVLTSFELGWKTCLHSQKEES